MPASTHSNVDFPLPLGPVMATDSPACTARAAQASGVVRPSPLPYETVTSSHAIRIPQDRIERVGSVITYLVSSRTVVCGLAAVLPHPQSREPDGVAVDRERDVEHAACLTAGVESPAQRPHLVPVRSDVRN